MANTIEKYVNLLKSDLDAIASSAKKELKRSQEKTRALVEQRRTE